MLVGRACAVMTHLQLNHMEGLPNQMSSIDLTFN